MAQARGRLSSMDLLPDEAQDDVMWAMGELNARARTQADILFELNDRLAAKGIDGISKSAFNRTAVRTHTAARRINETRAVFAGIADKFTPESMDETNIVIGELIKLMITDLLDESAKSIGPKGAMELAQAYVKSIQGQAISTDRRRKLEEEFAKKAGAAVAAVGAAKGLSADVVQDLRAQILGVKQG